MAVPERDPRPGDPRPSSDPAVEPVPAPEDAPADAPTSQQDAVTPAGPRVAVRLFGTSAFFRLWLAQVVSSLGDWIGFFAIVVIAERVGGASPEAAISLVMTARILPGFFLGPVAGVLVDRWDRKRLMVACDVGRGLTLATLPFVGSVVELVLVSLVMEILTLLWSPAKEATVPHLVPPEKLATANSLSMAAAYGTFPVASLVFAALAKVAEWLGRFDLLAGLALNQERLAVWFDVATFFVAATLIATLALPRRRRARPRSRRVDLMSTFRELKEGWVFVAGNPVVRAVMVGIGTGLIGGGMLVPLGPVYTAVVLGGGPAGFGLVLTALGFGVAGGVVGVSVFQRHLPHAAAFTLAVVVAGLSLILGGAMSSLAPALGFVAMLGVCAGAVYVLGFTILHESVADDLRGRIFSTLYTLVRLCLLISFALGPLLAGLLGGLSARLVDGAVGLGGVEVALPGVRLALWLAGAIIIAAGTLAWWSLRRGGRAAAGVVGDAAGDG